VARRTVRIVDAHHHVWNLQARDQPWIVPAMAPIRRSFELPEFRSAATDCNVGASVLVQCLADTSETAELLAAAADDEVVAGVVGYVDLTAADVGDQLDSLGDAIGGSRLVGIRHVVEGEADSEWLCRPAVVDGLRQVAHRGLVYDLLVRSDQMAAATAAAAAVPEGRFVLDHLGKPPIREHRLEPWASQLEALARQPNVSAKVSGLFTEADWHQWNVADLAPYVRHALDVFGPSRLLFGSDWPVCLLATDYARQIETLGGLFEDLSRAEQSMIFGDNAVFTYGLTLKDEPHV
jgi:L-fuconolactonase